MILRYKKIARKHMIDRQINRYDEIQCIETRNYVLKLNPQTHLAPDLEIHC